MGSKLVNYLLWLLCAAAPPFRSCPFLVPILASFGDGLWMWKRKPDKPFPPDLFLVTVFHHSSSNPNQDSLSVALAILEWSADVGCLPLSPESHG